MEIPDLVKAAPKNCKVLFENPHVRVIEVVMDPGEKLEMHHHKAFNAWLSLAPAEIRETARRGRSKRLKVRPGRALWSARSVTHSMENVGKTQYRSLAIELNVKGMKELKK